MEKIRKPFQGVTNIIRFNWHFYLAALLVGFSLFMLDCVMPAQLNGLLYSLALLILVVTGISLLVSFYVYDFSGLYRLDWLPDSSGGDLIVNIHAGFDETSELLQLKYSSSELMVFDFYDPLKHTEISIKRARKMFSSYPNTITISTSSLPLPTESVKKIFVIFAAHEIRSDAERVTFFKELKRVLQPNGEVYVTEHLRDLTNFLAYNVGFLHFLSRTCWYNTFVESGLILQNEQRLNPLIINFTLIKNGTSS